MALRTGTSRSRRLVTGALVLALHAALGALLLRPILLPAPRPVETLVLINVPAPPPPAPVAETAASLEPAAQAAPPAPRRKPRPVAAPVPPEPSPEPVAQAPSTGTETASGAAAAGSGTGAAGSGVGTGSGGQGAGSGGGAKPRWRSGRIDRRDYPDEASRAGATGSVTVTLDITPDGRVSGCTVVRSSGTPALDATTCRLARQRFRFEPARDTAGNPVPGVAGWRQDWWLEPPR
jgi:protein TonB